MDSEYNIQNAVNTVGKLVYGEQWKGAKHLLFDNNGFAIGYSNNSSVGNRYIDTRSLVVNIKSDEEAGIGAARASQLLSSYGGIDWRTIFNAIFSEIFIGPAIVESVRNLAHNIDDGQDVDDVRKVLREVSEAMWSDAREGVLFSDDFTYTQKSYSGWSRST
jgi:hypothetical protein